MLINGHVKDAQFCKRAVDKAVDKRGQLDVLVNNAAFQVHTADIEDLGDMHFDETRKPNPYGYLYIAKASVPHLKSGPAIVNTGSVTGLEGSQDLLRRLSVAGQ